jgi:hypothetical protein
MFDFLKYIQPANYYRLIGQIPLAVLCDELVNDLHPNPYRTEKAWKLDRLYNRLQSGNIPSMGQLRNPLQNEIITDVLDNYTFIRRYFSVVQVFYVFYIRLISFKNPLKEIFGLMNALWKVKREKLEPFRYGDWDHFQSNILNEKPLVSVIIPTLNRYDYLNDVLADLELQDYFKLWEAARGTRVP